MWNEHTGHNATHKGEDCRFGEWQGPGYSYICGWREGGSLNCEMIHKITGVKQITLGFISLFTCEFALNSYSSYSQFNQNHLKAETMSKSTLSVMFFPEEKLPIPLSSSGTTPLTTLLLASLDSPGSWMSSSRFCKKARELCRPGPLRPAMQPNTPTGGWGSGGEAKQNIE